MRIRKDCIRKAAKVLALITAILLSVSVTAGCFLSNRTASSDATGSKSEQTSEDLLHREKEEDETAGSEQTPVTEPDTTEEATVAQPVTDHAETDDEDTLQNAPDETDAVKTPDIESAAAPDETETDGAGPAENDTEEILTSDERKETDPPETESVIEDMEGTEAPADENNCKYVLNLNTKKFHIPSCQSVKRMNESNKLFSNMDRDEIISSGYSPCKNCSP